jgi:hypothetical protein
VVSVDGDNQSGTVRLANGYLLQYLIHVGLLVRRFVSFLASRACRGRKLALRAASVHPSSLLLYVIATTTIS